MFWFSEASFSISNFSLLVLKSHPSIAGRRERKTLFYRKTAKILILFIPVFNDSLMIVKLTKLLLRIPKYKKIKNFEIRLPIGLLASCSLNLEVHLQTISVSINLENRSEIISEIISGNNAVELV